MFEKYDINDLFLASIDVIYPRSIGYTENIGGILECGPAGYGYITILLRDKNKYIDLQNKDAKISNIVSPFSITYKIDYIEPLSKYYTQDGKKKDIFSRRNAIKTGQQYYNDFHQDHMNSIDKKIKLDKKS